MITKDYDKVILATGSLPVRPPIEGIELASSSGDYLLSIKKPGKKIVVIGGLVGCETATYERKCR